MAKSGENFITLSTLEEKGFDPLDYRYFCLGVVYRKPLMFSYEALKSARNAREKLFDRILELKKSKHAKDNKTAQKKYVVEFNKQVNNDLNTPKALAVMWGVIKDSKLSDHDKYWYL